MWWPFQWLIIYVLGGLTFVPLLVIAIIGYVLTYGSVPIGDPDPAKREKAELQEESEKDDAFTKARSRSSSLGNNGKPLSGWLTVRRQFQSSVTTTSIFLPNTTTSPDLTAPDTEESTSEKDDVPSRSNTSTPSQPTTYSARIAQTYRQVMESRQKKDAPPKEYFYCVLKGTVLFLYEDEAQSECVAAIGVNKYTIGVEGKEGGVHAGKDSEMFAKRNAIVMRIVGEKKGLPVLAKGMGLASEEARENEREMESTPWFLFSKSNTKMEDWYLALVQVSAAKPTTTDIFSNSDMRALVDTIDTEPDPIPMRWLNAILGRIFFGLYRTEALEQFIIGKIMKKLSKVARPSFLGPIVIREVNVGTFPPIFSKPMLKDLTAEGTASFEVHLNYRSRPSQPNSEVRITIATTATIPTGFKPYVVDLVLAVVVKSLEGNMVVQIKKPPSNRFWYGFTHMPKMEIEIRPIVSERKIQIGMILNAIEKQLRDVIAESVVLPNMDDIAFFDTSALDIRGGIFSSAGKVVSDNQKDVPAIGADAPTQPGVDMATVAEDPTSAIAETPGLRKRHPQKSHTLNTRPVSFATGPTGDESDSSAAPEIGIVRTETAPPLIGSGSATKKAAAVQATKKWFAQTGRPSSIGSLSAVTGKNGSQESLGNARSSSTERRPGTTAAGTSAEASSSAPELAKEETTADVPGPVKGQTSFHSLARSSIDSTSTASTGNTVRDQPVAGPSSPGGSASTASLISSFRTRDKKAIQTQVTSARDAVKKWGVNWAAKRKTTMGSGLDETTDENKPAAIYRPPDEDDIGDDHLIGGLSQSADAPKSLKERLEAATAAAQRNRPASGSFSSGSPVNASGPSAARPIFQAGSSPSASSSIKGDVSVGSPPKWTLSSSGPTTEIAKDTTSAALSRTDSHKSHHSNHSQQSHHRSTGQQERRASHSSAAVLTQPRGGRSMVVPRIPKRPGEVVGIGSSDMGITRRISDGGDGLEKRGQTSSAGVSIPPPSSSSSSSRKTDQGKEKEGVQETAPRKEWQMDEKEAPRSSPQKMTPRISPSGSSTDLTTTTVIVDTDSAIDTSATPSPPDGEDLKRSDSAPPQSNLGVNTGLSPDAADIRQSPAQDLRTTNGSTENNSTQVDQPEVPLSKVQTPSKVSGFDVPSPRAAALEASEEPPEKARKAKQSEGIHTPKKGDSGSSAENVLRDLVKRDEEVRAQKEGEQGG